VAGQEVLGDTTKIVQHLAADSIVPAMDAVIIELLKLNTKQIVCQKNPWINRWIFFVFEGRNENHQKLFEKTTGSN